MELDGHSDRVWVSPRDGINSKTDTARDSSTTPSYLKISLTNMANASGKEIVVAEVNWPISCHFPASSFPNELRNIPFLASDWTTFMKIAGAAADVKYENVIFY
ncbi:hypothetical protein GGR54DRAFT_268452 [Hypoxylon sp. NC1633]|nr:hypothetical protein GGR54DRAFT_268452 [Hypoxylon sp. NC1633]